MIQRFHFDLTDGKATLPDKAGVLAGDLREAIEELTKRSGRCVRAKSWMNLGTDRSWSSETS